MNYPRSLFFLTTIAVTLSISQATSLAEGNREFQQPPNLPIPFVDSFDAGGAVGEFPAGWNGTYLDGSHNFRLSDNPPVRSEPFTEPAALELFAEGQPLNGFSAMLYLIVPKRETLWFKFDFYFDVKTNNFRAGLGNSAAIQIGISAVDKRFFVITRKDGVESSNAIPAEYIRPNEWNTVQIGQDGPSGYVILNGQEIALGDLGLPPSDYVKFLIGSQHGGTASLFIDNVKIDISRLE